MNSAPSIKPIYHRNRRGPVPVQSVRTQTSISIRLKPSVSRYSRNKRTRIFANQHLWLLNDPIEILSCSRCVQVSSELARLLCVKNNSSDSHTNFDLDCPVKNTTLNEQLNELLQLSLQLKSLKVAFPQEHHVNFFRMSLQNLEIQWSLISSKYSRTVDTSTVKSNQASIGSTFFILGSLLTKMYDILIKIHVYRYTQGFNKAVEGCLLIAVYLRLYLESGCNPPFSFLKYLKQDREKVIDMLVNFKNVSDAVFEKIPFSEIHSQCKQRIAVAESHVDNAVVSALVVLKDIVMKYSCIVHNQPLEECEFEDSSARTNVQIPTMEERMVAYPEKTFETTSAKRALLDMLFFHDSLCFTQPSTQHSLISDQAIEIYMLASNPSFDVDSVQKKMGILLYQKFQTMMQRYGQTKDEALRQEKKEEIMSILYQYYYKHVILAILKKRQLTSLEMSQMLSLSPGIDSVSDSSSSQLECSSFTKCNDNGTAVNGKIKSSDFNHTTSFVSIEDFITSRKTSNDHSLQNSHLVSISPIKPSIWVSNHFVNDSGASDTVVHNGPNNSRDSFQQDTNLCVSSANSYKNVHQVSTPLRITSPNDLFNNMISNYPINPPMPGWNVSHVQGGDCSEPSIAHSNSVQPRPSASPVYVQSSTHSLQPSIPPCRPVVELSKHHIMNVIREKISTQLMQQTNIVPSCDTSNIVVPRVSLPEAGGSRIPLSVISPLTNARNLNDVSVDSNVCTVPTIVSKTSNVSISRGTAIKSQMIESCATKPVPIVLTSKPSVSCSVQHNVNDTTNCKHQPSTSIEQTSTVPISSSIVTNTSTAITSKGYTTTTIVNSVHTSASIPETSDASYTRSSNSTDSKGCSSTTPVSTIPSLCTTVVTKQSALEALLKSVSSNHEKCVSSYHTSDYRVTSVGNKRAHPSSYTPPQVRSTPYTTTIDVPQVRSTSYTTATVLRSTPYTTATVPQVRSTPYTTATVPQVRSAPYTTATVLRSTPYTTATVLRSAPYTTATVLRSTPYTTATVLRSAPYTTATVLRSAPYTTATVPPTATVLQSTPISTAPRKSVVCIPIKTFQALLMPDARNSLPRTTGVTLCPPPFTCISSDCPCPPPIVSNILPPQTNNKYANTPRPTAPNVFPFQYPAAISANNLLNISSMYTLQQHQHQIANLLAALQNNLTGRQSVHSLNHITGLLQSYNLPAINNILRTMIPTTLHPNESRFNTTQVFCPSRQSSTNNPLSTSSNCFTPPTSIMSSPNVRCTSSMVSYTLPQPDSHTVSTAIGLNSCRMSTMNSSCSLPTSTVNNNSMRLPNNISTIPYISNASSTSSVTLSSSQRHHISNNCNKTSKVTKTGLNSLPTIPPVYSAGKTPSVSCASSGNIPTIVSSSIKRKQDMNYVYDVFLRNVADAITQTSSGLLHNSSSLNATGTKVPCSLQSVQGFSHRPNPPSMMSGNSVTGNITINAQCKSSNLATTSLTQSIRRTPLQSIATGNIVDPVPCSLQNVKNVSHRPNMMLISSDNSMSDIIAINSDTCKLSKTSLTPSIRQTPIQSESTGTTIDTISCSLHNVQSVSHQPNPPSMMSISSGNSATGNVTINTKSSNIPKTSVTLSIGQTPLQTKVIGTTVDMISCSLQSVSHQPNPPSMMSISSGNYATGNVTKSSNILKTPVTLSIGQTPLQTKVIGTTVDTISCSLQSVSHQQNPPSMMSISSGNSATGSVTISTISSNIPKTSVRPSIGQTPLQSKATVDLVPCSILRKNAHQPTCSTMSGNSVTTINTTMCKSSNIPSKCVAELTPSIPQTSLQSKTSHKQIGPDNSIFNSQWHSIIPFAELQYRRANEQNSSIKDPRLSRHEGNPLNSYVETNKPPSQCTTNEPPMPSGEASNGPRLFLCIPSKPNHSNKRSIDSSNETTITANAQVDLPTQVDKPLFSSTQIETNKTTVQDDPAIVDSSFVATFLENGQHMSDVAANRSPSVSAQLHHSMDNAKGNDQHKHTCSDDAKISPLADPQSNQPLSIIEDPISATDYQENQSKSNVDRPCLANGDQPTLIDDCLSIIEDPISATDYQENQSVARPCLVNSDQPTLIDDGLSIIEEPISVTDYYENQSQSNVASGPCLANGDQPTLINDGLSPSTNSGVVQSSIDVIVSNNLQSTITSVQHTVSDTATGCTSTGSEQVTVLKSKLVFNVTVIDHSLLLKWGLNTKDRVKMEKDIECFDVCYAKLPDESHFTYDGCCSAKWTSMGVITPLPLPMSATLVNLHTKECYMFFVKAVLSGGTRIIFSDIKFVEIM